MVCPVCDVNLILSDRSGIEIDYCPQCRGVWLDRGELDKIIDCSSRSHTNRAYDNQYEAPKRSYDHHEDHHNSQRRHKKESFLGDLFDF